MDISNLAFLTSAIINDTKFSIVGSFLISYMGGINLHVRLNAAALLSPNKVLQITFVSLKIRKARSLAAGDLSDDIGIRSNTSQLIIIRFMSRVSVIKYFYSVSSL